MTNRRNCAVFQLDTDFEVECINLQNEDVLELAAGVSKPGDLLRRCDGVLIVDTFICITGTKRWDVYVAEIMEYICANTLQKVTIVVLQPGSWLNGDYAWALRMIKLSLPQPPEFMIWVSMGADLYPPGRLRSQLYEGADSWPPGLFKSQLYELERFGKLEKEMERVLTMAKMYCPKQSCVFGGSSKLWSYHVHFTSINARVYDKQVDRHMKIQKY